MILTQEPYWDKITYKTIYLLLWLVRSAPPLQQSGFLHTANSDGKARRRAPT